MYPRLPPGVNLQFAIPGVPFAASLTFAVPRKRSRSRQRPRWPAKPSIPDIWSWLDQATYNHIALGTQSNATGIANACH